MTKKIAKRETVEFWQVETEAPSKDIESSTLCVRDDAVEQPFSPSFARTLYRMYRDQHPTATITRSVTQTWVWEPEDKP